MPERRARSRPGSAARAYRLGQIIGLAPGHELVEADPVQDRGPHPGGMAVAQERDHRHAHPQRLAAGGGAAIGERVEGDVDLAIEPQMAGPVGDALEHPHPVRRDAGLGQPAADPLFRRAGAEAAALEQQPGAGHRGQEAPPQPDRGLAELEAVVERAEGDVAAPDRRRRGGLGGGLGRRAVAQKAARQPAQPLDRQALRTGRVGDGVDDPPVDRREPGGVGIAEPARLHRCRPPRQQRQPVALGVPGQLDQDVDAVGRDQGRHLGVAAAMDVVPAASAKRRSWRVTLSGSSTSA